MGFKSMWRLILLNRFKNHCLVSLPCYGLGVRRAWWLARVRSLHGGRRALSMALRSRLIGRRAVLLARVRYRHVARCAWISAHVLVFVIRHIPSLAVIISVTLIVVHILLGAVAIDLVSSGLVTLIFSLLDIKLHLDHHSLLPCLHSLDRSSLLVLVISYLHTKQFRPR